ncbi:transcription factor TFIIIC subunit tfc4 [Tulasnella sp. 403]|nr:transcription factor TFIIIC subunit tfc4 [Tulasnella sp. 403]
MAYGLTYTRILGADENDSDDSDGSIEGSLRSESEDSVIPGPLLDDDVTEEAEGAIAGDFQRLVNNIRTTNNPAAPGSTATPWVFSIDEGDDFSLEDGAHVSGSQQAGKGKKRRARAGVELSHQVKAMIGEAAAAYVDRDLVKAMEICQEVIRIEPAAHAAWNTLALVHEDRGEPDTALKLKIMAAHLQGDADLWRELGRASRETLQMQQALYCFRKAVSLDPHDVDAIWDRSVVLQETGENRAALNGFLSILKEVPFHMGVLVQLGQLFSILSEFHRGITLYRDALKHYQETMPAGPSNGDEGDCILLLVTMADFCNTVGEHEQAINAIRDGARWVQGRAAQRYWATITDDREYDVQGCVRQNDESGTRPQGFFALDPNLRHRLALARLALGDFEEAQMHGSVVLKNDAREYYLLFTELAGAYFDKGLYAPALRVYEELAAHDETSTVDVLMQISACHRYLGDFEKCIEVLRYVLDIDESNMNAKMKLAEVYEILDQPRTALNLVKEVIAWRKSHEEGNVRSDRGNTEEVQDTDPTNALFEEKKRSKKARSAMPIQMVWVMEQARQNRVDEGFKKLESLDPEGDDRTEWMKEASALIEMFRGTRELFGGNRFAQFRGSVNERRLRRLGEANDVAKNASDMESRLQQDLDASKTGTKYLTEFRRHSFDEWLCLFIKYAFLQTRDGSYAMTDEILRHVLYSNAYATFGSQTTIRLALLACATVQRDYPAILEHSRKLIYTHQFNNDPLRLFLACLGSGIHTLDTFIDVNFQKAMKREVASYKLVAEGSPMNWDAGRNRWHFVGPKRPEADTNADGEETSDDDAEPVETKSKARSSAATAAVAENPSPSKATKESPVLLALYAHISSCTKSYQSALFYLYQAYDIQPDDPVVCLMLAVASISRAMQRQSDNRHHLIAQGLAFIQRYRAIRKEGHGDEVEYNFGRWFHQLGLLSLAAKHYEAVLEIVEKRSGKEGLSEKDRGLSREAAYNLVLIYGTTGGTGLAKEVARKWLSF